MAHKRRGQLTTSPEWAKHLRAVAGRWFWKGERRAERRLVRAVLDEEDETPIEEPAHPGFPACVATRPDSPLPAPLGRPPEMKLIGIDHIVLCVRDIEQTKRFYADLLGMEPREAKRGRWSLHFGDNKISLQDEASLPELARGTTPGSGNFCLIAADPIERLVERLDARGIPILAGPDERDGATGPIRSVYFRDPDGNLVEVSNRL